MMWGYKAPMREEFDTEEEYQEALRMWEWAEDERADAYVEEYYLNTL